MVEYLNENDSEDGKTNKTSAISSFLLKILPDDQIVESISWVQIKRKFSRWFIHGPKIM